MALSMAQKEFRRRGVSASDIAALCGVSRWKKPIKVYEEKIEPPEEDSEPTVDQEFGNRVENMVLDWTAERVETPIFHNTGPEAITFQSRKHELALATPDGLAFEDALPESFEVLRAQYESATAVVEVKAPGRTIADWTSPLEMADGIPDYYIPQVHWQMGVLDLPEVVVGALIGREPWIYRIAFNAELFKMLLHIAEKFWENHVLKQIPPPVDESKDYAAHLVHRYPGHASDELCKTNPEVDVAVIKLREAKEAAEGLDSVIRLQQNIIKGHIGDAAGIEGPWGKIYWKKSKDSESWDTKAMRKWFEKNEPKALEKFRKTKSGGRSFKPYLK